MVQIRLMKHLTMYNLLPVTQSAYRRHHSTETYMVRVLNDLLMSVDSGNISAMCFLDLSAAFDTVDYEIMLKRLEFSFGITG